MELKLAAILVSNDEVGMQYANSIIDILNKGNVDNTFKHEPALTIETKYCRVIFTRRSNLWQLEKPDYMLEVSVANPTVIKQCEEMISNYILQCEVDGKNAEWKNR